MVVYERIEVKKFIPLILLFTGCANERTTISEEDEKGIRKISIIGQIGTDDNLVEVKIDGCDYIVIGLADHRMMAHKGNCKACQKRLEETLIKTMKIVK